MKGERGVTRPVLSCEPETCTRTKPFSQRNSGGGKGQPGEGCAVSPITALWPPFPDSNFSLPSPLATWRKWPRRDPEEEHFK